MSALGQRSLLPTTTPPPTQVCLLRQTDKDSMDKFGPCMSQVKDGSEKALPVPYVVTCEGTSAL